MGPGNVQERSILLAVPDRAEADRLTDVLVGMRYSVERAEDGLGALRRLQGASPPAMALLNNVMPKMGGLDVAMELRRRAHRGHLWLMLMSSTPSADEVVMATEAGIDEFLVRPVDPAELRMRVRTGERVQSIYREISGALLEFHATHDPLTNTWNREAMLDLLFQETDRAQRLNTPLALMLVDVDRFVGLDKRFHHATGEKLLPMLALRLRSHLRSYDSIGRYTEDEFLLALPGCAAPQAGKKAQQLCNAITEHVFTVDGTDRSVTANIGVAEGLGRSPLIVLREAERALFLAKQQGRNCVHVYDAVQPEQTLPPEARRRPEQESAAGSPGPVPDQSPSVPA